MAPKDTIDPYDDREFLKRLDEIKGAPASILIGLQSENSAFGTVTGFMGRNGKGFTHLNAGLYVPTDAGQWSEQGAYVANSLGLVCDDVGNPEKAPVTPPLTPTVKVETSAGSEQWLYVYNEPVDPEKASAMANGVVEAGMSDPFIAKRAHHWFRLPNSLPKPKIKQGRTERAKIIEFSGITYGYDELAKGLGVTPKGGVARPEVQNTKYDPKTGGRDPIVQWATMNGHTAEAFADSRGFYDITCPNAAQHSDQERPWARYVPPNAASQAGFVCHHAHCNGVKGKQVTLKDLRESIEAMGGPTVAEAVAYADKMRQPKPLADLYELAVANGVFDPADRLDGPLESDLERFFRGVRMAHAQLVWFEPKGQIFDLEGSEHYPLKTVTGVKVAWCGLDFVRVNENTGKEHRVSPVMSWRDSPDKKVTDKFPYVDPRHPNGWTGTDINLYRPFVPSDTPQGTVEPFLDLMRHVFPLDHEYALDWIAHKLQKPWVRGVALVNYTSTMGTGRGAVCGIVMDLLGHHNCEEISAERLFGSQASQFNPHMDKILLTIAEAARTGDEEHRAANRMSAAKFNKLKELVEPDARYVRIERKGIDGQMVEVFTSYMIATNDGAGLPLEKGDRRFSVCKGNSTSMENSDLAGMTQKGGWLDQVRQGADKDDYLTPIYEYLMARDVSHFRHNVPHHTDAKDEMIADNMSMMDRAVRDTIEMLEAEGCFLVSEIADVMQSPHMMDQNIEAYKLARRYDEGGLLAIVGASTARISTRPVALTNKSGQLKVGGKPVRPRALNGYEKKVTGQADLRREIEEFQARCLEFTSTARGCPQK